MLPASWSWPSNFVSATISRLYGKAVDNSATATGAPPTGPAITSGLWLDAHTQDRLKLGFCKQPIAAGKGTGNRLHDIEPGNAAASIFEFRMDSADPAIMMPEVGRSVVHREGVQLIRDWINAQPGSCGSAAGES